MKNVRDIDNYGQDVYTFVSDLLAGKDERKIANNTYLRTGMEYDAQGDGHGTVSVVLHFTEILRASCKTGHVVLNSGGYHTTTTKDRLNRFLPNSVRVRQHDFAWYVDIRQYGPAGWRLLETRAFEDGMVLDVSGPYAPSFVEEVNA